MSRGTAQSAGWVREMFSAIAPRYDLLNRLLSFNIDKSWRGALLRRLAPVLERPAPRILDLCCGTGDVLLDLQKIAKQPVLGADFCRPMLHAAAKKARQRGFASPLFEADALHLPLSSNSLDAIAIAFGFRNLVNYQQGLNEFYRVLKPGGLLAILEFSHPPGFFVAKAYGFYSAVFLPVLGGLISGSREAYSYLPASVRKFPRADELCRMFEESGFENVEYDLLTSGIAALHMGQKALLPGLWVD